MALGPLGLIDLARPPLTLAQPIIELAEEYLLVPSGIGADQPMRLTAEQVEVLWAWYSVTPNGRRYVYNRKLILRMAKGWAKSPIGAVCNFAALVGDVIPDGLDAHGQPVGRPHPKPWAQVAANSLDQTDNLYKQLFDMLKNSSAIDDFHIDLGITKTTTRDGGLIEPVTSEAGTREGQPISDGTLEETHLYRPSNGGVALAATIHRNATKMNARVIELTNAYIPGAGSVAQRSEEKIAAGRASGVLWVCRQGQMPDLETDQIRDAVWVKGQLEHTYGQASMSQGGWVDLDRVTQDVVEASDDEISQQLRFFFNIVVAPEEAALDIVKWSQLASNGARLTPGETIALGFDGSDSSDSTALYACRWPDWTVFKLQVWNRPVDENGHKLKGPWKVDRAEVKSKIRQTCLDYRVLRGYADDSGWQSEIDELSGEFDKAFMRFPHRKDERIGPACERWSTMVEEGTLRHDGDPTLSLHSANARKVHIGNEKSKWWRPGRRVEGQPIDALSAAISAVHALGDAVAHGEAVAAPAVQPPMFAFT